MSKLKALLVCVSAVIATDTLAIHSRPSVAGEVTYKDGGGGSCESPAAIGGQSQLMGVKAIWKSLSNCVGQSHGFLNVTRVQKSLGIEVHDVVTTRGGSTIADYDGHEGCGLTLRLEVDAFSPERKMSWMDAQNPSGINQESSSVLNFSCRNDRDPISLPEIRSDLDSMGFKKIGEINSYPRMEAYSKFEGLEQVFVYYYSPPESAPVIGSITIRGFKLRK